MDEIPVRNRVSFALRHRRRFEHNRAKARQLASRDWLDRNIAARKRERQQEVVEMRQARLELDLLRGCVPRFVYRPVGRPQEARRGDDCDPTEAAVLHVVVKPRLQLRRAVMDHVRQQPVFERCIGADKRGPLRHVDATEYEPGGGASAGNPKLGLGRLQQRCLCGVLPSVKRIVCSLFEQHEVRVVGQTEVARQLQDVGHDQDIRVIGYREQACPRLCVLLARHLSAIETRSVKQHIDAVPRLAATARRDRPGRSPGHVRGCAYPSERG